MKIVFLKTDPREQRFFATALARHSLHFVSELEEVPLDAEVVSVFIGSRITPTFLESHPSVKLIATRSTTFDHVDLPECARRGVLVSGVPTYGDHTVAEHTMALMLAIARRLRELFEVRWHTGFSYEALRGTELRGKTLGIIGTGRIGMHVMPLARSFGMRLIAYDINPQPEAAEALDFDYVPLEKLLRRSHILTLHAALTPESRHMLNRDTLAKCRRGVLIVNTARGSLIDTGALLEALDKGIVAGAALDVLEEESVLLAEAESIIAGQIIEHIQKVSGPIGLRLPDPFRTRELQALMRNNALLSRKNVIFTPHCAFNTVEALEQINCTTVANIRAFIASKPANLVTSLS